MPERRALCIGVSRFAAASGWGSLPDRMGGLARALRDFGYDCRTISGPAATGAAIGAAFDDATSGLSADDLLIVTVLSHGDLAEESGELYVIGADGVRDSKARAGDWVRNIGDLAGQPRTLFLLDLCQAGAVARAPQLRGAGVSGRSWILAACPPGRPAYDGRFTEAITNVLRAVLNGARQIHESHPYLPLSTLAADCRSELKSLVDAADAYPQEAIGGYVDLAEAAAGPPFFANPAYRPDQVREARRDVDDPVGGFVDELDAAVDPYHYIVRAAGRGPRGDPLESGCFTGRAAELKALSGWLDRGGPGALRAVTGSPGAGKSALLGVLVCAAHPKLRPGTERLWFHATHTPAENEDLAVVHARQRGAAEILASTGRQLGLGPVPDWPALGRALRAAPGTPVLIVDALDEALEPEALARELLALVRTRKEDGSPACRLLAGFRPWPEFDVLRAAAEEAGGLVDLDGRSPGEDWNDVESYVRAILTLSPPYNERPHVPARDAFASSVAAALTAQPREGGARWGLFLVAALCVHRLLRRSTPLADEAEAAALGRRVPRTLPEVLNLDLADNPALRPVLAALAHARGEGMPLEIVESVLPLFGARDARRGLAAARFYLRHGADADGSTLYRLFHQALADHLRRDGLDGAILDRLLPGAWDAGVRPYVRRHAIEHAAAAGRADELLGDPRFLVHADPAALEPRLDAARADGAAVAGAVYRSSAARHRGLPAAGRGQVLGIDALRWGARDLAADLAGGFARLRPRWATGSQVTPALRMTVQAAEVPVYDLAADPAGRAVVVAAAGRPPAAWDLTTGEPVPVRLGPEIATSVATTEIGGHPAVVTGDPLGALHVRDLETGRRLGGPLPGDAGAIATIACVDGPSGVIAVAGAADGSVFGWDLSSMSRVAALPARGGGPAAVVDGGRILVATAVEGRFVLVRDLLTGADVARYTVAGAPARICLGTLVTDGPRAILAGCGSAAWLLEPAGTSARGMRDLLEGWDGLPVRRPRAIAGAGSSEHPIVVVGCDDGLIHVAGPFGSLSCAQGSAVTAVTCAAVDGHGAAITAGRDGRVRMWEPAPAARIGRPRPGHLSRVSSLAAVEAGGRDLLFSADPGHEALVHELAAGRRTGTLPATGPLAVWHPEGSPPALLAADASGLRAWDPATLRERRPGPHLPVTWPITALAAVPVGTGEVAVLGGAGGELEIWDLASGARLKRVAGAGLGRVARLVPCPGVSDRGVVVSLSGPGAIRVWDLGSARERGYAIGAGPDVADVACARVRHRHVVLAGMPDGRVRRWDLHTAEERDPPLHAHRAAVTALACGRLGAEPVAVTAGEDAAVRLWNLRSGTLLDEIAVPEPVHQLLLIPTGTVIAAMNWEIVAFTLR